MLTSHPDRTAERLAKLNSYMSHNVLTGRSFTCRHYGECLHSRADTLFYPGQLHHVGCHFDLERDGRELRVVVLGQEYGTPDVGVSIAERTAGISGPTAQVGFARRNPHMKGTTSILRLLLGRDPGEDAAGERLFDTGHDAHIFDAFALVDAMLCSAIENISTVGAARGCASDTMYSNCGEHLREVLRILQPTLIVVQGKTVRSKLPHILGLPGWPWPVSQTVQLFDREILLFNFVHPSAPGSYGWWGQSVSSSYLKNVVEPEIRRYVQVCPPQQI